MTNLRSDPCSAAGEPHGPSWIARLVSLHPDGGLLVAPAPAAHGGRLFGGLVAAQALAAAATTVDPGRLPQSLHAYFVRGGRPGTDVAYDVERTRDGRSFATRRVTAIQAGEIILEMLTSFHVSESGHDWHPATSAAVPLDDATETVTASMISDQFEIRVPEIGPMGFAPPPYWLRSQEPIADDPVLQACTLTYLSDMGLLAAARPPGATLDGDPGRAASLDHSVWFHRPYDPSRWHRYEATKLNNSDARGLVLGTLHDHAGMLVATTAQEGLWRS